MAKVDSPLIHGKMPRMRTSLVWLSALISLGASAAGIACGGGTVDTTGLEEADSGTSSSSSGGSSSGDASSGGSSSGGYNPGEPPAGTQRIDELPTDRFTFFETQGDTVCALGGKYGFAVRPGDPSKVVVEFEGGGACWSESTCDHPFTEDPASATYKDFVLGEQYTGTTQVGLRDHANQDNPVQGWTHVIVPYCSADVHWGDSESQYEGRTVQHRGFKNTSAVLAYLYSQVTAPEHVFVTGCSAGGYGSIYYTPGIREHYPQAQLRHLSDSAAGVIPPTFFPNLQTAWGFESTFPGNIGANGASFTNLAYLYSAISTTFSDITLSQYNVYADTTQAFFYSAMGGSGWQNGMKANLAELLPLPNYRNYLSEGSTHCIIEKDEFYTKEVEGVKLSAWVRDLVNDQPGANVACADCTLPTE